MLNVPLTVDKHGDVTEELVDVTMLTEAAELQLASCVGSAMLEQDSLVAPEIDW